VQERLLAPVEFWFVASEKISIAKPWVESRPGMVVSVGGIQCRSQSYGI
jgi:hypothetical protein